MYNVIPYKTQELSTKSFVLRYKVKDLHDELNPDNMPWSMVELDYQMNRTSICQTIIYIEDIEVIDKENVVRDLKEYCESREYDLLIVDIKKSDTEEKLELFKEVGFSDMNHSTRESKSNLALLYMNITGKIIKGNINSDAKKAMESEFKKHVENAIDTLLDVKAKSDDDFLGMTIYSLLRNIDKAIECCSDENVKDLLKERRTYLSSQHSIVGNKVFEDTAIEFNKLLLEM